MLRGSDDGNDGHILVLATCGGVLALTGGSAAAVPEAVNGYFNVHSETGASCDSWSAYA